MVGADLSNLDKVRGLGAPVASIGGAGTFLIGVMFFGDAGTLARWVGVAMIVGGVVTLKMAH